MKYDRSLGDTLRDARMRAGLSQPEVARHIGASVQRVSDVERGHRARLTHAQSLRAAALLDVSPALMLSLWARRREDVPLYRTGEERRDYVAAALSAVWDSLTQEAVENIAKAVGL
ncbi:helix-turn-helix transcriptional regulator [Myxococcus eversor]|uniref:helix-turn-helix transcriptional regulator n=1 Tax=Myxococcus eversor TaxID=2709661 RepID=UPI001F082B38|nr:helix-turn-helix transcriptional regulator [Myxococcus eversor]